MSRDRSSWSRLWSRILQKVGSEFNSELAIGETDLVDRRKNYFLLHFDCQKLGRYTTVPRLRRHERRNRAILSCPCQRARREGYHRQYCFTRYAIIVIHSAFAHMRGGHQVLSTLSYLEKESQNRSSRPSRTRTQRSVLVRSRTSRLLWLSWRVPKPPG